MSAVASSWFSVFLKNSIQRVPSLHALETRQKEALWFSLPWISRKNRYIHYSKTTMAEENASVPGQYQKSRVNRRVHDILAATDDEDDDDVSYSDASESFCSSSDSSKSSGFTGSDGYEIDSASIQSKEYQYGDVEQPSIPLQRANQLVVSLPSTRSASVRLESDVTEDSHVTGDSNEEKIQIVEHTSAWARYLLYFLCILILLVGGTAFFIVLRGGSIEIHF